MSRPTIEEMVNEVIGWFEKDSDGNCETFKNCHSDDLVIYYYSTLGQDIKNHFKLWQYDWEKVLVDGIDHSPTHPDNLSLIVIKEVHKKIQ